MSADTYTPTLIYRCIHTDTHIHTYTHTHTQPHTQTHTHTQALRAYFAFRTGDDGGHDLGGDEGG